MQTEKLLFYIFHSELQSIIVQAENSKGYKNCRCTVKYAIIYKWKRGFLLDIKNCESWSFVKFKAFLLQLKSQK